MCICRQTMNCTQCKSSNKVKRGIINGRQRHTCNDCVYIYTVVQKSTSKPESIKRKAMQLYLEGLVFHLIGRILQVSHVSVYNWIKSHGSKLHPVRSDTEIEAIEMNEIHSYILSARKHEF